ncbi:MAG: hypothetical protein BGO55_06480 [Sphingobacteriales bacterium 50-39]|nr:hypothetical protein [Sphingobacteriales bacterium]OJW52903.1 MAG: hypothetical protein BGO55_06480 [Sphingobacteriales bacterium 50-39]
MIILRIEHKVSNFEGWKKVFDSDPLNRKKSGVKRYHIYRPTDDPNFAIVDLEFERLDEALATKAALQNLWPKVEGTLISGPQVKILQLFESKEY